MRRWEESWAIRTRSNDDRVVRVMVTIALLTVAAELCGVLGYW